MSHPVEQPLTPASARECLDLGLELVIERARAHWKMPGRSAIRFQVDRSDARDVFAALKSKYHTRCSAARRVLTPEPIDDDPIDEYVAVLDRPWHTTKELADIVCTTTSSIRQMMRRYGDRITKRKMQPQTRGGHTFQWAIRSDDALRKVLATRYDVEVVIRIDESVPVREGIQQSATLERREYFLRPLAEACGRSRDAAYHVYSEFQDRLNTRRKPHPVTNKPCTVIEVNDILAAVIADRWNLDVTLVDPDPQPA